MQRPSTEDDFLYPWIVRGETVQPPLEQQVVADIEPRQQVELLKNKAEMTPSEHGDFAFTLHCQRTAHDQDFTRIGALQPGRDLQKGALAVATGAEQGDALARPQVQVDTPEHLQLALAIVK